MKISDQSIIKANSIMPFITMGVTGGETALNEVRDSIAVMFEESKKVTIEQPAYAAHPFNFVNILTTEKMFRFANISLQRAMEEVLRYFTTGDIIKIECY